MGETEIIWGTSDVKGFMCVRESVKKKITTDSMDMLPVMLSVLILLCF